LVEDRFADAKNIHREPGDAIEGDNIIIWCRKPDKWQTARGSENHNYFKTTARKNALAYIMKSFTNLQKSPGIRR
jgi:hypothetical protein